MELVTHQERQDNNIIRTLVRSVYDLQKIRMQMGNRLAANFRSKLGVSQPDGNEDGEKILNLLKKSYARLTDGIVDELKSNMPSPRKFVGDELITSYAELSLVDQYVKLLASEEQSFGNLGRALKGIPIYDQFLADIRGVGPAMAGVIISEIDIHVATYPSSLWAYAGLDTVQVARYMDDQGKLKTLPANSTELEFSPAEGRYYYKEFPIELIDQGRSRKSEHLVEREYTTAGGELALRKSITYNPFLKTKLMGVLASSFIKSASVMVDGKRLGKARRLELAQEKGLKIEDPSDTQVNEFLAAVGITIEVDEGYSRYYYDRRRFYMNHPHHKNKTAAHHHNMAARYMVKRFLVDLYTKWRALEGLPISTEYAVGKLGIHHGEAKAA